MSRWSRWWIVGIALSLALPAAAYEADIHQQLTFVAARHHKRCHDDPADGLTTLEVRRIVKGNIAQAESNAFVRMFRWSYYHPGTDDPGSLLWLIDTRFNSHFNDLVERLGAEDDAAKRLELLGRILFYVQEVTSPAHVTPVYTSRFWRFSMTDRFDVYEPDEDALDNALKEVCRFFGQDEVDPLLVLESTARDTLAAVRAGVPGMPATWEAFWRIAQSPGEFGEYGPAGNTFGRRTEFRCADQQRCVLLDNDPLYRDFALERHVTAVVATMRLLDAIGTLEMTGTGE